MLIVPTKLFSSSKWNYFQTCLSKFLDTSYTQQFLICVFLLLFSSTFLFYLTILLFSLLFFISSWKYSCKFARKINTYTHVRESMNRQVYTGLLIPRWSSHGFLGFNVSLMNLSLLLRRVTTTISCPLLTFSPLLFCQLLTSPLLSNSDPPNHFVAHWLLS